MAENNTAYLSNKGDIICFSYNGKNIRFRGPYSLEYFSNITDWDNGNITVDAKYAHSDELIEDYIDLNPILSNLYVDSVTFLKPIERVEINNA